jgi:hypothetical protein
MIKGDVITPAHGKIFILCQILLLARKLACEISMLEDVEKVRSLPEVSNKTRAQ